jgi:flagellar biosynthesis protein FliQ
MNHLVTLNISTLFLLTVFYLTEKIAQFRAFSDYTNQVQEVILSYLPNLVLVYVPKCINYFGPWCRENY